MKKSNISVTFKNGSNESPKRLQYRSEASSRERRINRMNPNDDEPEKSEAHWCEKTHCALPNEGQMKGNPSINHSADRKFLPGKLNALKTTIVSW